VLPFLLLQFPNFELRTPNFEPIFSRKAFPMTPNTASSISSAQPLPNTTLLWRQTADALAQLLEALPQRGAPAALAAEALRAIAEIEGAPISEQRERIP
jgi:hypothetical protein